MSKELWGCTDCKEKAPLEKLNLCNAMFCPRDFKLCRTHDGLDVDIAYYVPDRLAIVLEDPITGECELLAGYDTYDDAGSFDSVEAAVKYVNESNWIG